MAIPVPGWVKSLLALSLLLLSALCNAVYINHLIYGRARIPNMSGLVMTFTC